MKAKSVYFCTDCGYESPKWYGKCPSCGQFNTMAERPSTWADTPKAAVKAAPLQGENSAVLLSEVGVEQEDRFITGIGELDRVLGGGAVKGSLVLMAGEPGIGKSTLLLQISAKLVSMGNKVLYVTGEESLRQLKMRADRLHADSRGLYVLAETDMGRILSEVDHIAPDIVIADSVQTMSVDTLSSAPGSVAQVKECTLTFMRLSKGRGVTVFIVGHVNKEGAIAGPKVMEHMVDCVLSFEGSQASNYRILRAVKNRFGSTNEIGVFEMQEKGLLEVPNPSESMLSGRPINTPGTCVTCVMEGTRPILAEVQALVTPSALANARRTSNGVEYNRALLLLAVLEKRGGFRLSGCDSYINVIGGLNLNETAGDLATILAIASSFRDVPVPDDLAAFGEVGLTGELRAVKNVDQRLGELQKMGFSTCIIPKSSKLDKETEKGIRVLYAGTISEAMRIAKLI